MGADGGVISIVLKEKADPDRIYMLLDSLNLMHQGYNDSISEYIRNDETSNVMYSAYGTDIDDPISVDEFIDSITFKKEYLRSDLTFEDIILEVETYPFKVNSNAFYQYFDFENDYNDLEIVYILTMFEIKRKSWRWQDTKETILNNLKMTIGEYTRELLSNIVSAYKTETWT